MKTKYMTLFAVAVCFLIMAFPSISGATPVLRITSGSEVITITDGDSNDSKALSGVVGFDGSIGGWLINATTGITILGTIQEPVFDLNSVNVSFSQTPTTITMELSDSGFIGNGMLRTFTSAIGGTTYGTLTYKTYYGTGLFDKSNEIGDLSFTPLSFSGEMSNSGIPDSSFSMTQVVTITHAAGNFVSSSFNGMLSDPEPLPEPSSLILLGSGLLGTALFFRRKY